MRMMKKWALATGVGLAAVAVTASADELADQWPMLNTYCMECHSYDEFRGELALEGMGPEAVLESPDVFEEVLRKLKIRAMPPRDQPQPSQEERARFVASLESTLDAAAAANPHAGTTTIHRLNRAEYTNAIRDLLGVDVSSHRRWRQA